MAKDLHPVTLAVDESVPFSFLKWVSATNLATFARDCGCDGRFYRLLCGPALAIRWKAQIAARNEKNRTWHVRNIMSRLDSPTHSKGQKIRESARRITPQFRLSFLREFGED
jgi:hypothetical protein